MFRNGLSPVNFGAFYIKKPNMIFLKMVFKIKCIQNS